MKKLFLFMVVLFATIEINAQLYFHAEKADFYDGKGNYVSTSYFDGKSIEMTNNRLIVGDMSFWFYGGVTSDDDTGTITSMARPSDGSGNCKVVIAVTTKTTARIELRWTNFIVKYYTRY